MERNIKNNLVKIVCQTYNEIDLIESFILYYGELFGYKNVIIIDHASTDRTVFSIYDKFIPFGLNVIYLHKNNQFEQGINTSNTIKQYCKDSEFVFPMDTDEFLVMSIDNDINYDVFKDFLENLPKDVGMFRYDNEYISCPSETHIIYKNPVLEITNFEKSKLKKVFFRTDNFDSVECGNHNGLIINGNILDVSDKILRIHYHDSGYKRIVQKSYDHLLGFGYISSDDSSCQAYDKLLFIDFVAASDQPAHHKIKYYLEFLKRDIIMNYFFKTYSKYPKVHTLSNILKSIDKNFSEEIITFLNNTKFDDYLENDDSILYKETLLYSGPVFKKNVKESFVLKNFISELIIKYFIPNGFDVNIYRNNYQFSVGISDTQLKIHHYYSGRYERIKCDNIKP